MHIVICFLTFPSVYFSPFVRDAWYPLMLPLAEFGQQPFQEIMILIFHLNWVLLLVNLLPVYPLDGGRMLEAVMRVHNDPQTTKSTMVNVGMVIAVVMMFGAILLNNVILVMLGAFILIMNHQEHMALQFNQFQDDGGFMGYDFSQGYTSLEQEEHATHKKPGFFTRWRESREAEKKAKEQEKLAELEQTLDTLLAKVSEFGMQSLTPHERKQLNKASEALKERGKKTNT